MKRYSHSEIRNAANELKSLCTRYGTDYNAISADLKPEAHAARKKELLDKFNAAAVPLLATCDIGAGQLAKEREAVADPVRALVLDGVKSAPRMNAGEAWLAAQLGKLPATHRGDVIQKLENPALLLAMYLEADKSTDEGKATIHALLENSPINASEFEALRVLEKNAREAVLAYRSRPGAGLSPASKMMYGRQIHDVDHAAIEAAQALA